MKRAAQITPEEREVLTSISEIVLSNPFGDERERLEQQLAPATHLTRRSRVSKVHELLANVTEAIGRRGLNNLQQIQGDDRRLMANVFSYYLYVRYRPELDKVIQQQLLDPSGRVSLDFADVLLRQLADYGFTSAEGVRYLGFFYQLRRAFHFIEDALIGDSASMRALRSSLWSNVFTNDLGNYRDYLWNRMEDFSTLILGETGTGKGSAANAIGRSAYIPFDTKTGSFVENFTESLVTTNLSQYPEGLIESELFGHRKGSFTGAIDSHSGLFGQSRAHGSLFLDEIGDISTPIQLKLLQVLQERTFTPVGSHDVKRFLGRVIAATNRPLLELREQKLFRDDFFYRLCSDVITVPPLRQRIEESPGELELLVDLLLTRLIGETRHNLTDAVMGNLVKRLPDGYSWPGNVRELEQAVRRILLTGRYEGEPIKSSGDDDGLARKIHDGTLTIKQLSRDYCSILYGQLGTYEDVARRTGLDRRTVKKYLGD